MEEQKNETPSTSSANEITPGSLESEEFSFFLTIRRKLKNGIVETWDFNQVSMVRVLNPGM